MNTLPKPPKPRYALYYLDANAPKWEGDDGWREYSEYHTQEVVETIAETLLESPIADSVLIYKLEPVLIRGLIRGWEYDHKEAREGAPCCTSPEGCCGPGSYCCGAHPIKEHKHEGT